MKNFIIYLMFIQKDKNKIFDINYILKYLLITNNIKRMLLLSFKLNHFLFVVYLAKYYISIIIKLKKKHLKIKEIYL